MKNPQLHTRDSLGKVRVWYMEQDGGKYRTVSGVLDGELVTSEWTSAKPKNVGKKNETTADQQAASEIAARYKKQRKLSYFDEIGEIDQSRFVEPMLAKLYRDYRDEIDLSKGDWVLQCKFNGMRCVATKDGLFTRKGERYVSCPHIEEALKPFFEKNPEAVLDGELFNHNLRQQLNEISKLVRRTVNVTQHDLERSKELVRYYIYDGYGFGLDKERPYHERKRWIDGNVVGKYAHVAQVEDFSLGSQHDLDRHYNGLVDDGHEGAILRHRGMKYEHKRSKNLLKVKPEDDDEAEIVDIIEGEGNWSGTGKVIKLSWKSKEFDATFKGTREEAVQFLKDKKKWVGKTVTFLYNGLTGLGTPNYARVDIRNCTKGDQ